MACILLKSYAYEPCVIASASTDYHREWSSSHMHPKLPPKSAGLKESVHYFGKAKRSD
ncbi:hypothetical protein M407DRAFT_241941 [Tulasnella calospora MUT 4182]|uniref:Uncharacterized protein n=1 Tax=Tulasnella calospora MUT 4182 TaxID=1051891 RepID=A0A0C3QGZ6_9AGAM|nr:hypothetical protein M407DRAFT_241941 [Tulasnella calospora MUT 4182]